VEDVVRPLLWGFRAALVIRPRLRRYGPELPRAPLVAGPRAERTIQLVCRVIRLNCLESALVRQAWAAGQGHERRLILGVTSPSDGFKAHAWLEGDPQDQRFTALQVSGRS
jgi:Transglutaminase-like superfamily